jgi:rhodanese-related sulfurtransferase
LDGGLATWIQKGYPTVKSGGASGAASVNSSFAHLSSSQAASGIAGGTLFVLDSRPAPEFSAGHVPGAVNISLEKLDVSLSRLPKGRMILVYDRAYRRSREAAEKISKAGFAVSLLGGGLEGWIKGGNSLEVK